MTPAIRSLCTIAPMSVVLALANHTAFAQETTKATDLLDVSCADYLQALDIARVEEGAAAARKEEAEKAQDDIVSAMLWLHGHDSGRQPPGTAFAPLTEAWISEAVIRVAKACQAHSPDGRMRLADAATKP